MKRIVRFVLLATCLAPLWLFAEADRFVLADGQTSLDFTDPHPFWRQHLANPIPKDGEQRWFQQPDPWELHWEGNYITVRPRIIEPRDVTGGWGGGSPMTVISACGLRLLWLARTRAERSADISGR